MDRLVRKAVRKLRSSLPRNFSPADFSILPNGRRRSGSPLEPLLPLVANGSTEASHGTTTTTQQAAVEGINHRDDLPQSGSTAGQSAFTAVNGLALRYPPAHGEQDINEGSVARSGTTLAPIGSHQDCPVNVYSLALLNLPPSVNTNLMSPHLVRPSLPSSLQEHHDPPVKNEDNVPAKFNNDHPGPDDKYKPVASTSNGITRQSGPDAASAVASGSVTSGSTADRPNHRTDSDTNNVRYHRLPLQRSAAQWGLREMNHFSGMDVATQRAIRSQEALVQRAARTLERETDTLNRLQAQVQEERAGWEVVPPHVVAASQPASMALRQRRDEARRGMAPFPATNQPTARPTAAFSTPNVPQTAHASSSRSTGHPSTSAAARVSTLATSPQPSPSSSKRARNDDEIPVADGAELTSGRRVRPHVAEASSRVRTVRDAAPPPQLPRRSTRIAGRQVAAPLANQRREPERPQEPETQSSALRIRMPAQRLTPASQPLVQPVVGILRIRGPYPVQPEASSSRADQAEAPTSSSTLHRRKRARDNDEHRNEQSAENEEPVKKRKSKQPKSRRR
ncbi:hypothetical protein BC835DRAFT_1306495 [Cytidiella melzeri]|nr:hypothetical protein BC835DRAFT_1306495 [Cytidiella melzeri]